MKQCNFGYIINSDPTIARKELDLRNEGRKFVLERVQKQCLMKIIKSDCKFFEENFINDYSLLVGVHKLDPEESLEPNIQNSMVSVNAPRGSSSAMMIVILILIIGFLCRY